MSARSEYPPEIVACLNGDPTPEQWAAISAPLGPAVIVAGAGSGKTAVMAARVAHLAIAADTPIAPGNVLCLTFTNKATDNLVQRIRRALAAIGDRVDAGGARLVVEGDEPLITNYHRFGQEIVSRYGMLVGAEPGQRILTPSQRTELCAKVLDRMRFEHVHAESQGVIVSDILRLADQAANHRVTPEEIVVANERLLRELAHAGRDSASLAEVSRERIELARGVRVFHDLKREYGVIDFGDQIDLALRIVEENPSVVAAYRERFPAVLLDEYQDTNVAQAALLRTIFGDGHPVTAVGDPDQNIYAWRGASLHNLLRFPVDFALRDGTPAPRYPLYTNFRSGSRILAAADEVIAPLPAEQRPDPDKALTAWPERGAGRVELRGFADEFAEASAIAEAIADEHDAGTPWRDIAVLCRKHRLYRPLRAALERRGIPAEFSGLAGLLQLPEIVEVLAYARAVVDPTASVAYGRILTGPRYRIGVPDLAAIATWARERSSRLRVEDGAVGEEVPVIVSEALDHLDEIAGLSDEARIRLVAFTRELTDLRALARGPVATFLRQVIRRIGLLEEIEAGVGPEMAAAARRNVAAFLDQIGGVTPLDGDLTLPALLRHLDAAEREDRDEWTQPATEIDAVRVMTIHGAKGLEFEVVFVPGLTEGILPSTKIQQNPAERAYSLDFELRGDRDILPRWGGVATRFKAALRDQEIHDERRTCYVALTRAKRRLWASGANWYDGVIDAKDVGRFLEQLWAWGERTEGIEVARIEKPEKGAPNPLEGGDGRPIPTWPGPARPDDADDLFPEGWRRAAAAAEGPGVQGSLLDRLAPDGRERFAAAVGERRTLATHLAAREREAGAGPWLPPQIPVNGIIEHARCPKRFAWTYVRPLPRSSGRAARIGTEVHRWIERQSRGQVSLFDGDDETVLPDLTGDELADRPEGDGMSLREHFLASRFAGLTPLHVERSFLLAFGRFTVSGRIDAIFGAPDGAWEVVDWKTGKRPDADDPTARMQLDLYALACIDVWRKRPEDLTLTYVYLRTGEAVTHPVEDATAIRARVEAELAQIETGRFDPVVGPQCRWCDFRTFCEAGRTYLAAEGTATVR
ncbi:MAG: ATP-dependent DNA helicase [Actinomycetota bacterium]